MLGQAWSGSETRPRPMRLLPVIQRTAGTRKPAVHDNGGVSVWRINAHAVPSFRTDSLTEKDPVYNGLPTIDGDGTARMRIR